MPAIKWWGVTSNAGFQTSAPSGASCELPDVRHLASVSLLDGNVLAVGRREIDRRERRRHVERNRVLACQHGHAVGADLVRRVAVGRNAIGADDDEIDLPLPHQRPGHVVGDHGRLNAVADQFPGREPRALQKRARLVGKDRDAACRPRPRRESRRAPCRSRPSPARPRCSASGCARRRGRLRRQTPPSPGSSRRLRRESPRLHDPGGLEAVRPTRPTSAPAANDRFMRSIAQKRLTAVGRVDAISSQSL